MTHAHNRAMRCDAVRCGAVRCGAVRFGEVSERARARGDFAETKTGVEPSLPGLLRWLPNEYVMQLRVIMICANVLCIHAVFVTVCLFVGGAKATGLGLSFVGSLISTGMHAATARMVTEGSVVLLC